MEKRDWAQSWLFGAALPIWLKKGADRLHGGWFDRLEQTGDPVNGPKRLRVQARQIFVFAEAGRLGWSGDWREGVEHGLAFMLSHYRRKDGFFRAAVSRTGEPINEAVDIYDQAFVIFALAAAYGALGRPQPLLDEAVALLERMRTHLAHPDRGFEETNPRSLPLRSNPHMHLLEAMLAWIDQGATAPFTDVANEIVDLALDRMIDPETGAVGEYFDGDWCFSAQDGQIREPGHQFEWAYLLHQCKSRLGGDHAAAIARLVDFGNRYGVIEGRAIFSVDASGQVIDRNARLWAQTERLRTMLVHAATLTGPPRTAALAAAAESVDVLRMFFAVPVAGLWSDWVDEAGKLVIESVPASSLYHIVTGLVPLIEAADLVREAV